MGVRLSHLPPSAPLADRHEASAFQAEQAGSIPAGRSENDDRGSASGRPSGLEPGDGGSTPPPRTPPRPCVSPRNTDAGSSNGRMRRSERRHVGSSPAPAASRTEVIRPPDEEPVLKTGGGQCRLWVRVPRLPLRGHGPTGRRRLRKPEIRVRFPVTPLQQYSPVVQRQRHLVHTQETMVRLHPGLLDGPGTPIGRAAWLKPFGSGGGSRVFVSIEVV
mgnify:CR=1 FL=1